MPSASPGEPGRHNMRILCKDCPLFERFNDFFAHFFGVAEQHHRGVAVEQLILDTGVAGSRRVRLPDQTSLTSKSVSISAGSWGSLRIASFESAGGWVPGPPRQKQETSAFSPS